VCIVLSAFDLRTWAAVVINAPPNAASDCLVAW
jgi:hypothetical protein